MPKIKKYVLSSAGALLVATAAVGGFAWQKADNGDPRAPTVSVQRGNLIETAAASGKIEPDVQVEVKSRVAGQVIEVLVKEGDTVEAGQLLVKLDPVDAQRQLSSARVARSRAQADVMAAKASLSMAELEEKNSSVSESLARQSAEVGLGSSDAARSAGHATRVAASKVTLSTNNLYTSFDSTLYVLSKCDATPVLAWCEDYGFDHESSAAELELTDLAASTYYVVVDSFNAEFSGTTYQLDVSVE